MWTALNRRALLNVDSSELWRTRNKLHAIDFCARPRALAITQETKLLAACCILNYLILQLSHLAVHLAVTFSSCFLQLFPSCSVSFSCFSCFLQLFPSAVSFSCFLQLPRSTVSVMSIAVLCDFSSDSQDPGTKDQLVAACNLYRNCRS